MAIATAEATAATVPWTAICRDEQFVGANRCGAESAEYPELAVRTKNRRQRDQSDGRDPERDHNRGIDIDVSPEPDVSNRIEEAGIELPKGDEQEGREGESEEQ